MTQQHILSIGCLRQKSIKDTKASQHCSSVKRKHSSVWLLKNQHWLSVILKIKNFLLEADYYISIVTGQALSVAIGRQTINFLISVK